MVPKQLLSGIGHHFIMKGRVPTNLILATSDGGLRATTTRERMKILRTTTTQEQLNVNDAFAFIYIHVFFSVFFLFFFTRIGGSFFNQVIFFGRPAFFSAFPSKKKWFLVAKNLCPCLSFWFGLMDERSMFVFGHLVYLCFIVFCRYGGFLKWGIPQKHGF